MIRIPKRKLKKLLIFFKKLPMILGGNAFLTFLGLLLFSLILGSIIFYKYSVLVVKEEPEVFEKPLEFKEKTYQEILEVWQEREKRFEEANPQKYLNPLQPIKEKWEPEVFLEEKGTEAISELSGEELESVLAILNLYQFYKSKGEKLPPIEERAELWENFGLGTKEEYVGSRYQNEILLEELKKG